MSEIKEELGIAVPDWATSFWPEGYVKKVWLMHQLYPAIRTQIFQHCARASDNNAEELEECQQMCDAFGSFILERVSPTQILASQGESVLEEVVALKDFLDIEIEMKTW